MTYVKLPKPQFGVMHVMIAIHCLCLHAAPYFSCHHHWFCLHILHFVPVLFSIVIPTSSKEM